VEVKLEGLEAFQVLVTHANGRESMEYIARDLNLSQHDDLGLKAALRRQGINASRVQVQVQ